MSGRAQPRWTGIPCGHPPEPVAWRDDGGRFVCHCARILDPTQAFPFESQGSRLLLVFCDGCGCHVLVWEEPA